MANQAPRLFMYSLILPAIWMGLGTLLSTVAPNFRLGAGLSIVMFGAIAVGISWLFVRNNKRMFTNSESWRMVIYCSVIAIFLESWVLLTAMVWPDLFPGEAITRDAAIWGLAIAAVIDTLAMIGGFRVAAPRYLKSYIAKYADASQCSLSQDELAGLKHIDLSRRKF